MKMIMPGENHEPLVNLQESQSGLLCRPSRRDILMRKGAAEKLQRVQRNLSRIRSDGQLVLVEGYRHPFVQESEFLRYYYQMVREYPLLDSEELTERVHQWVALPSVAGHPTGGAIDVTVAVNGQELDMGGSVADFSCPDSLPTFAASLTREQQLHRKLLHDLMLEQEFAPFYGEWWHYSYGDREWAAFYGCPQVLYGPLYF